MDLEDQNAKKEPVKILSWKKLEEMHYSRR
jgi:hypothetical protein